MKIEICSKNGKGINSLNICSHLDKNYTYALFLCNAIASAKG